MKKFLSVALSAAMLLSLPLQAFGEEQQVDTELEGFVTELVEGGFILNDIDMGEVLLNVDDTTVLDGVVADSGIVVGLYVIVQYDGRLTKSIPPQAHADKVGCYVLNGMVGEFMDGGIMLTGDPLFGDVLVHVDGISQHIYPNVPITVYYDGIMALSLPGQVVARTIIVPELTGIVSERDELGFTLTVSDDEYYRVFTQENTLVGELVTSEDVEEADVEESSEGSDNEGATDDALTDTDESSADAADGASGDEDSSADSDDMAAAADASDASADEAANEAASDDVATTDDTVTIDIGDGVPATPADDPMDANTADPDAVDDMPIETPVEISDGDTVTVYFNGITTRSIPPQVNALEILVLR